MKSPVDQKVGRPPRERRAAAPQARRVTGLLLLSLSALLTGCLGLKPDPDPSRFFVLSSLPAAGAEASPAAAVGAPRVGLRAVNLPPYLEPSTLAVRQTDHEIRYLEFHQWAERLDKGVQRVLANNLARLLPCDRVHLSTWRRDEVDLELSVALERFEVDVQGSATLLARWEITAPGADKKVRTGQSRITREGPPPATDPGGAVAALSELLAEWSRELSRALKQP